MRAVSTSAILLVLTAGAASSPLAAQRRELTVLAGGNLTSATGDRISTVEARTGFQAGVSLRVPRTSTLYFQTGLLLVQRRLYTERTPTTQPTPALGPRSDAPRLTYAQVPVLVRLQKGYSTQRPVRPFLVFGAYLSARIGCTRELIEASGTVSHPGCGLRAADDRAGTDTYFPAAYQVIDLGVLGELGVEIRRFSLAVRGEKSLRNMVDPGVVPTSPLEKARIWSASLSIEYLARVL